jgi:hypothetical protein
MLDSKEKRSFKLWESIPPRSVAHLRSLPRPASSRPHPVVQVCLPVWVANNPLAHSRRVASNCPRPLPLPLARKLAACHNPVVPVRQALLVAHQVQP